MAEQPIEHPYIQENKPRAPYVVKQGDGISHLGTNLWIRESSLSEFSNSWEIRANDVFTLKINPDETGVISRKRGNATKELALSKEAIFQDIEQWPKEFPYIKFLRVDPGDTYMLVNAEWTRLGNIQVPSKNLDQFRKEVAKISGVLITECGSRKAQNDLACSIKSDSPIGKNVLSLNSKEVFDFIPSNIVTSNLMKLTDSNDGKELIKHLAKSLPLK